MAKWVLLMALSMIMVVSMFVSVVMVLVLAPVLWFYQLPQLLLPLHQLDLEQFLESSLILGSCFLAHTNWWRGGHV